jgi:hypothetical protein
VGRNRKRYPGDCHRINLHSRNDAHTL